MKKLSILGFAVLAMALAGCAKGEDGSMAAGGDAAGGGAKAAANEAIELKYQPKEGETYKYTMAMNMEQGDQKVDVTADMTMKATKVEPNKITMENTIKMKMKAGDQTMDMPEQKMTTVSDSTGKTLEQTGAGASAGNMAAASYPTKPIKVGDTWTAEQKQNVQTVTANYKLVAVEDKNGMKAAKIETTMGGLPEGFTLDGPMVMWVEVATGLPIEVSMKGKGANNQGSMTMTMKRA